MKVIILLSVFWCITAVAETSSEKACSDYLSNENNIKSAHTNKHCLEAANEGSGSAQYSVGLSYGFAGQTENEEKYYRLAANNRTAASYLALGHMKRERHIWESIYWYQRFVATKSNGYGYAALQLSDIFASLGNAGQSKYWLSICKSSNYDGCNN